MDPSRVSKNVKRVAGIEISKGEPGVVKALQKLWQKLQLLEQAHHIEKANTAKVKNDYTLAEVQRKLLELQLQYVRSVLNQHNNDTDASSVPAANMYNREVTPECHGIQLSSLHGCVDHIPVRDSYDKHTQTDSASTKLTNSLYSDDEASPLDSVKNPGNVGPRKMEFMLPDLHEMKVLNRPTVRSDAVNGRIMKKNPRSHYHLKLSDVPFIIGTSTSSHSVVANVQRIISMMKVHNKGLCSSAPNLARRSSSDIKKHSEELGCQRTYSNPDLSGHWDLRNILQCLTDELKTLTSKLGNMKKISEGRNSSELNERLDKDYANTLNLIEVKTKQIAALHRAIRKTPQVAPLRQSKSTRESSPLSRCTEKLSSVSKDGCFMNRISKTEVKEVICSFSDASCKADCSGRRKMMQELKRVQIHLQHEDIHWK